MTAIKFGMRSLLFKNETEGRRIMAKSNESNIGEMMS